MIAVVVVAGPVSFIVARRDEKAITGLVSHDKGTNPHAHFNVSFARLLLFFRSITRGAGGDGTSRRSRSVCGRRVVFLVFRLMVGGG